MMTQEPVDEIALSGHDDDGAAGANHKKKRSRRRRKPRSAKNNQVQPVDKNHHHHPRGGSIAVKKHHDAPMTKRDLYFSLHCELVSIGHGAPAVARVTMINWDAEVVLDTFVQVPVPVTYFRSTGITADAISTNNPQAMSFAKVRQSVHRILKGKILVGYNLQEHLTALGLTHPPSDVRDAATFQIFQYEEIDGISDEKVVVKNRALADLAAEFLQREIIKSTCPMDACIVALDLYKTYRKAWETHLVQLAHADANNDKNRSYYPSTDTTTFASHASSFEPARPRLPSYDESVPAYGVHVPSPPQERSSSWFSLGRNRQSYATSQETPTSSTHTSTLTPEALEALNYSQYGEMQAYGGRHHPYYGHGAAMAYASSSSNPGSSSYYENSSMVSDSYASESVASSSLADEGQQQIYQQQHQAYSSQPVQQTISSSSSWFRFGSRRTKYPEPSPKEPMTSLIEEEPEDSPPGWLEQQSMAMPVEGNNDTSAVRETDDPTTKEGVVDVSPQQNDEDEKPSSSSWFSFRRPKSPRPGKSLDDSGDERASTPNRRRRGGKAGKGQDDSGDERVTTHRRRRASLGSMSLSDSIRSAGRQSSTGSAMARRSSLDNESSALARTETEEPERQAGASSPSSWFSFRRSSKLNSIPKDRAMVSNATKEEDPSESNEQPSLQTEHTGTETLEEDWMREVLGSPSMHEKDLLAVSWDSDSMIGLEAPMTEEPAPSSTRQSTSTTKESKWLPRFLRSSKSASDAAAAIETTPEDDLEFPEWPIMTNSLEVNQQKILNPSFFCRDGGMGSGSSPLASFDGEEMRSDGGGVFFTRSRLETESTLPTVASEGEDEAFYSGGSSPRSMELNLAYLNL